MNTSFNSTGRPGLQKRTKKRAAKLGLDVKKSYTRGEARTIRKQLKREKAAPYANKDASQRANARNTSTLADAKPELRQVTDLSGKAARGVNTVATGPGSARQGKGYRVMKSDKGNWVHVYGRGKSAKRITLRAKTAAAYGYGDKKRYS